MRPEQGDHRGRGDPYQRVALTVMRRLVTEERVQASWVESRGPACGEPNLRREDPDGGGAAQARDDAHGERCELRVDEGDAAGAADCDRGAAEPCEAHHAAGEADESDDDARQPDEQEPANHPAQLET